jgi:cysteine-rich repeat protein
MKVRGFLVSALAVAGVLFGAMGAQGCGSDLGASEDRMCTQGAYVFCRCADRTPGTKLCVDGKKFGECSTDGAGACVGGEIDDPDTGKPVTEPDPIDPGPGNPLEACPGKSTAVAPGPDIVIDGDLAGAKDDAKGRAGGACAAGSGGPDHVYKLQPTGTGSLNIRVQGMGGLNPTAYLRTACEDEDAQAACAPPIAQDATVTLNTNVVLGREYFLVVDGASASSGKYKITMKLTTGSFCGDGQVDSNEACDDGNKTEGDGCSNDCRRVIGDPSTAASCPGHAVHVWSGQTVMGSGSTTSSGNTFTNTGTSCTTSASNLNASPDHVYEVTAHAAGTLVVTATPVESNFNVQLVGRSTCATYTTQNGCANSESLGVAETMSIAVANNQKVYVAVDGTVGSRGSYNITFRIQ